MGKLGYQIMPALLKRMDHYILLDYCSDAGVYCTDSEGYCRYRLTYEELRVYLSADGVPEADGCITIRQIRKKREYRMEEVLEQSLRYAADNLRAAEEAGEGSWAIMNCFSYLEHYKEYQWRLPLLYDIQYLKQRKLLLLFFTDQLEERRIWHRDQAGAVRDLVNRQNDLLGRIYKNLRKGQGLEKADFEEAAELESRLADYSG